MRAMPPQAAQGQRASPFLSVDLRRAGRCSQTLMFAAISELQASAELQGLAELQELERKFGIVSIENCFSNLARRQRTLRDGFRLRRVDPRIWTCPSAITQPSFGIQHRSNYAGHSASPACRSLSVYFREVESPSEVFVLPYPGFCGSSPGYSRD